MINNWPYDMTEILLVGQQTLYKKQNTQNPVICCKMKLKYNKFHVPAVIMPLFYNRTNPYHAVYFFML